ncbi:MAG: GNAT family N-acetyltransferase [Chloroflexi bacterium]|nr:GNAT family N-acetyltransferase [Chloroflexota bacterium]
MSIGIRRATAADAAALHALAAATFGMACPPGTREEDIAAFIELHLSEARFADYLVDPARILFLALEDGAALGYTMLVGGEPADPDVARAITTRPTIELSKIYVRATHHGSGLAAALLTASVDAASRAGAAAMWLGVNQHNTRANRFYEQQGFRQVGTKRFRVGIEWHDDFVRERLLVADDRIGPEPRRS